METESKAIIWTKGFISISIVSFIQFMGQNMMNTLIPRYADHLGADASMVGIVTSMFAITSLITCIVAGTLMSGLSKWWMLFFSNGIVFLALIIYSIAEGIPLMIIGRLLHGIGIGVSAPLGLVLVSETLPKEKMASGIGIYSLWQAIATAVGPSVGLEMVESIGYQNTFRCGSVFLLSAMILIILLAKGTKIRTRKIVIDIDHIVAKEAFTPTVIMFFLSAAYASIGAYLTLFADLCAVEKIGLFFTANAVCLMFSRPFCGRLSDKIGTDKVLIAGIIIYIISFAVIASARNLASFIMAGVVSAFGYGICHPTVQTMNMQIVAKERRGVAGTTLYIGISAGYIFGPVLAGKIIVLMEDMGYSSLSSYTSMFYIMSFLVVVGLIILLVRRKKLVSSVEHI